MYIQLSVLTKRQAPIEQLTGETPDISEYLDFTFYDWVWVQENAGLGALTMARWLGVLHRVGGLMSYYIVKQNRQVEYRTTVQRITNLELQTEEVKDAGEYATQNILLLGNMEL